METTDDQIRRVLETVRTIACVGFSPNPARPSHAVSRFLVARGYRVIPVNPGQAGREFLGETVRGLLADITEPVDMVDVFCRPGALPGVVDDALAALPGLRVLWTQLGVVHPGAIQAARDAGLEVIENRCPAIEIPRLFPAVWTV